MSMSPISPARKKNTNCQVPTESPLDEVLLLLMLLLEMPCHLLDLNKCDFSSMSAHCSVTAVATYSQNMYCILKKKSFIYFVSPDFSVKWRAHIINQMSHLTTLETVSPSQSPNWEKIWVIMAEEFTDCCWSMCYLNIYLILYYVGKKWKVLFALFSRLLIASL